VPFNDGYTVASMDMSTEYEVILLTSEGPKGRCMWDDGTSQTIWDRAGQAGAKQAADKVSDCEKVRGEESWYPTSRKNERDTPNFLYAALDRTACAPLFKERRMSSGSPRNSTGNRGYGAPGVLFEGDEKKPSRG
jgi:hypothetical protein